MSWLFVNTILLLPFLMMCLDAIAGFRARNRQYTFRNTNVQDFQILVPIWGNAKYLENIDYLKTYGGKVLLCTTGDETSEFYQELGAIAAEHGFGIFRDQSQGRAATKRSHTHKQRATSGTIRDRVIRNALAIVTTQYVVPLDADSTTTQPMSLLVGELERRELDIASIRLIPRNQDSMLAKLQTFEYRLAMQFRFVAVWLVSGACHVARTEVLRDIMNRHSLFFQGNDVETGLIASTLHYKVGHIPFDVLTTVPDKLKPWFRQRLAWSGGEFRLFILNFRFVFRHPFFWFYGGLVTICALPLRWIALSSLTYPLITAAVLYVALVLYLHRQHRNVWLLLMPLYALFSSLIMTPLGVIWYFYMALKDGNFGVIRPHRSYGSV